MHCLICNIKIVYELLPKTPPPAYPKGQSYPQLSLLSTFPTCHIPLTPNWHCTQTTPPFSLNCGEPTPSSADSLMPWPFYTYTSPNGNFMWTSTKQWLYYLLNVVLPPCPHSSSNTLLSLGVHVSDTLASSSTPNSFSRITYTLSNTKPLAFFLNSSPSLPMTQRYPLTTNSPSTNYWSAPYSPMPLPSGAIHRHLQLLRSKCLRVIGNYPRCTPISHTPLLTSNPFMSLFTVWQINFSTTVLLTLTLLSAKQGTSLYLITTNGIVIHTQTDQTSSAVTSHLAAAVFFPL
jgi:hypothetical protein